jgi:hypothetical protein
MQKHGLFSNPLQLPALRLRGWTLGAMRPAEQLEAADFLRELRNAIESFGVPCAESLAIDAVGGLESLPKAIEQHVKEGNHAAVWFESAEFERTHGESGIFRVKASSLRTPGVDNLPHIASQLLTPKTFGQERDPFCAPSVALQLLAKLGCTPWSLAAPSDAETWYTKHGVDYLVGLDVCKRASPRGTQCTTAGCGYWRPTGELVTSIWDAGTTLGETISPEVLRKLVPPEICEGKTIMIHRDGRWVQAELDLLKEHSAAVGFTVLPVSVVKGTGLIPRLYADTDRAIDKCDAGSVFLISDEEAIVATNPAKGAKMGTPMPLRIAVHPTIGTHAGRAGKPADLDITSAAESVFWFSRVHFSSVFQQPRLPVTIKAVDEASWLLSSPEMSKSFRETGPLRGPQQFWL